MNASRDSGGGFFLDEQDDKEIKKPKIYKSSTCDTFVDLCCEQCNSCFNYSELMQYFKLMVCNKCRQPNEAHRLISRTDAKSRYLLKDCDLDAREPILPFKTLKNPHNSRWGCMRLYLEAQVAQRALEVWGDEDALQEERDRRLSLRERSRSSRFARELRDLRHQVHAGVPRPMAIDSQHVHEFGAEEQASKCNDDNDMFQKVCRTCGYINQYEKM